jgi:small-conductance mechanosensitive channel
LRLQIAVQTRIDERGRDGRIGMALDQFSKVMNRYERVLLRRLQAGEAWTGGLATRLYKEFGISAKLAESGYASLQGKLKSAKELAANNALELAEKIASKQNQIEKKTKGVTKRRNEIAKTLDRLAKCEASLTRLKVKLDEAKPAAQAKALQRYKSELGKLHFERKKVTDLQGKIEQLKRDLHQHKRHVETLRHRHRKAKNKADNPSICFGTKKLFKAQFNLAANGFSTHAEWKSAWDAARAATFIVEGLASASGGNEFAQLTEQSDGTFDLVLRLPEAVKSHAHETVIVRKRDVYRIYPLYIFEG